MTYPRRVDANQSEIVAALRACGCSVAITSDAGHGFPDLVVGRMGHRGRVSLLIEVKDGSKPPSARGLTPDQVEFHAAWRGQIATARNVVEALCVVGVVDCPDRLQLRACRCGDVGSVPPRGR